MTPTSLRRRLFIAAALPLSLLISGCSLGDVLGSSSNTPPPPPVGIYRSNDGGKTWVTKNSILSASGSRPSLNGTNVSSLFMDPTDRQTLYLGSQGQGLYYSYDGGESWWASGPIRSGSINAVAVPYDASQRCTVFVATANRILKTTDCGRFWDQIYYDTRLSEQVLSLSIHRDAPNIILAGLTTGDIIQSKDGGKSWGTITRLPGRVTNIISHALNPKIFYVVVERQGMWKTVDDGATWQGLNDGLKQFSGAINMTSVSVDPTRPETIITASPYGLVRTTDAGQTWSAIPLLTPPGKAPISSVALNPNNPAEIYYTTDSTIFHSQDAGQTWQTLNSPVPGTRTILIVDPKVPTTLYLGANRPVQPKSGL